MPPEASLAFEEVFGEKWYLKICQNYVEMEVVWSEVGEKNSKNFLFWGFSNFHELKMHRIRPENLVLSRKWDPRN